MEGFKQEPIPKILLHRREMTKPLPELDENVLALATDYSLETDRTLLDINHMNRSPSLFINGGKRRSK